MLTKFSMLHVLYACMETYIVTMTMDMHILGLKKKFNLQLAVAGRNKKFMSHAPMAITTDVFSPSTIFISSSELLSIATTSDACMNGEICK